MQSQLQSGLHVFQLKNFNLETLTIKSQALKGNPWNDSVVRHNPVLAPKSKPPRDGYPVVLVLAGFTGNGPKYFGLRTFEANFPQELDQCVSENRAPLALYVFVDAMTFWGGSQFLNSDGMGRYEDYVVKELCQAISEKYPAEQLGKRWCVMGGSSGGYGALHLASKYPEKFSTMAAVAPDSFFSMSLLPEFYVATPTLQSFGGLSAIKKSLSEGEFHQRRDAHSTLNAIAMGLCYVPRPGKSSEPLWPIDKESGELITSVWKKYLSHDPIFFLKNRRKKVAKIKNIYLDVGAFDQFHLQFGTRQIRETLVNQGLKIAYSEFKGNHFDIGSRRPPIWSWLKKVWKK